MVPPPRRWLGELARKAKQVALNKSSVELEAEEAPDGRVQWGPHGAQLAALAEACYSGDAFTLVWRVLERRWAAAERDASLWRQAYKALLVTEHLLKHSSTAVVQRVMESSGVLEGLKEYR